MGGDSRFSERGSNLRTFAPRRVLLVWKAKSFFKRTVVALVIFGLFWIGVQRGGALGQVLQDGINYFLTKDYDLHLPWDWISALVTSKRGLDVKVTGPLQGDESTDLSHFPDLPVAGRFVRGFGWQQGREGWPRFHEGIELEVQKGALVRAVLPGRVDHVEEDHVLGKVIIIKHQGQRASLYGRLGEIGVRVGQDVVQGQAIGTVRDTFFHFELRDGDCLVDPLLWLQQSPGQEKS